jgi:hypothetical protein
MKNLICALTLVAFTGCSSVPFTENMTASEAVQVACAVLPQSQCFGAALDAAGIHATTCVADVNALVSGKIQLDFNKLKGLSSVCQTYLAALQNYANKAKAAVTK